MNASQMLANFTCVQVVLNKRNNLMNKKKKHSTTIKRGTTRAGVVFACKTDLVAKVKQYIQSQNVADKSKVNANYVRSTFNEELSC